MVTTLINPRGEQNGLTLRGGPESRLKGSPKEERSQVELRPPLNSLFNDPSLFRLPLS